jgi:membrane protein required for colicin V production
VNALDVGFVVLFALGAAIGLARGFVRILIGLLSLVVAFILANRYQEPITRVLTSHHVGSTPARIAAYALVFITTMVAGGLVAYVVGKILKLAMLSWADRMGGAAVGLLAAVLAAAFLVHPLVASTSGGSKLLAESKLAPYVSVVADICNAAAPDAVAKRYDEGIDALRKIWRGEGAPAVEKVKKAIDDAKKKR